MKCFILILLCFLSICLSPTAFAQIDSLPTEIIVSNDEDLIVIPFHIRRGATFRGKYNIGIASGLTAAFPRFAKLTSVLRTDEPNDTLERWAIVIDNEGQHFAMQGVYSLTLYAKNAQMQDTASVVLRFVAAPQSVKSQKKATLTAAQRKRNLKAMSSYPRFVGEKWRCRFPSFGDLDTIPYQYLSVIYRRRSVSFADTIPFQETVLLPPTPWDGFDVEVEYKNPLTKEIRTIFSGSFNVLPNPPYLDQSTLQSHLIQESVRLTELGVTFRVAIDSLKIGFGAIDVVKDSFGKYQLVYPTTGNIRIQDSTMQLVFDGDTRLAIIDTNTGNKVTKETWNENAQTMEILSTEYNRLQQSFSVILEVRNMPLERMPRQTKELFLRGQIELNPPAIFVHNKRGIEVRNNCIFDEYQVKSQSCFKDQPPEWFTRFGCVALENTFLSINLPFSRKLLRK